MEDETKIFIVIVKFLSHHSLRTIDVGGQVYMCSNRMGKSYWAGVGNCFSLSSHIEGKFGLREPF